MPIHNIYDRTLKIMARHYTHVFLALAFPETPVRLLGTLENVELSLPVRPVDFIHRIEYEGQEYLLHLEFQLRHETDFPRRLCGYYGALTEQFDLPVLTLVLYVRPRQAALPQAYEVALGEHVVNRFSYPVLRLWDHVDAIRSGRYRELAPLLLALEPDDKTKVLEEERTLILAEPDAQKRRDLLALAVTIATRHFDSHYLLQFFTEQEVKEMQEAKFLEEIFAERLDRDLAMARAKGRREGLQEGLQEGRQEGLQEGLQEGRQEGLQEGAQQAIRENILDILIARFNPSAARYRHIERQLETLQDVETLRESLLTLVQVDDLAGFEQALTQDHGS
jgi:predicted transposase YdaD